MKTVLPWLPPAPDAGTLLGGWAEKFGLSLPSFLEAVVQLGQGGSRRAGLFMALEAVVQLGQGGSRRAGLFMALEAVVQLGQGGSRRAGLFMAECPHGADHAWAMMGSRQSGRFFGCAGNGTAVDLLGDPGFVP